MREADKQKVLSSYTTEWDSRLKRWVIKRESWLPGYTAAHKATAEEALKYRAEALFDEVCRLNKQRGQISVELAHIDDKKKEKI